MPGILRLHSESADQDVWSGINPVGSNTIEPVAWADQPHEVQR